MADSPKPSGNLPVQSATGGTLNPPPNDAVSQLFTQLLGLMQQNHASNNDATTEQENKLKERLDQALASKKPVSIAFPGCADVLLALAREKEADKIWEYFQDYFDYERHRVYQEDPKNTCRQVSDELDCNGPWPSGSCLTSNCVTLKGKRHFYCKDSTDDIIEKACEGRFMRRLFIADAVWLYYIDRMGVFQILSKLIDAYANTGELPISNGSLIAESKDDVVSLVLEAASRQMEMGTASKVRDRNGVYRICLGWETEQGKALNQNSVMNTAFGTQFHKFIQLASDYFRDIRLATAIRGTTNNSGGVTVATVITIRDTLKLLRQSFENFDYVRSYNNTLSGIVWAITAMGLVRDLRNTIGIPAVYDTPDEYIPAAYDKLVAQKSTTRSELNRFEVHNNCASYARDILLDIEVLNLDNAQQAREIEIWLSVIEEKVEGYRTAYRSLTGIDLGERSQAAIKV